MSLGDGGGGGGAISLKGDAQGGQDSWGFGPGGRDHGGRNPGSTDLQFFKHNQGSAGLLYTDHYLKEPPQATYFADYTHEYNHECRKVFSLSCSSMCHK